MSKIPTEVVVGLYWGMHQVNKKNEKIASENFNNLLNADVNRLRLIKFCNLESMAYIIKKVRLKFRKKDYEFNESDFVVKKYEITCEAEKQFGKIQLSQHKAIGVINEKIEQCLITTTQYLELYKWILGIKPKTL